MTPPLLNTPPVRPVPLQMQTVLFRDSFASIERAVLSLGRSAELAIAGGWVSGVRLAYGDSSPEPCLTGEDVARLQALYPEVLDVRYEFFNRNMGSAGGQNRLADNCDAEFILIMNPDIIVSPRLIETLLLAFSVPQVGMSEAKQSPIEHPKDYDPLTGETSWASGACSMIPAALFRQLAGFDSSSFFMYCDDVDLSWRVRLAGYKIIFQPAAVAFHDKRLSVEGRWRPTDSERYYSAEAALMLAHKWSRADVVQQLLRGSASGGNEFTTKATETFERRGRDRTLPAQVDADHEVGQFVNGTYAKHRYHL
jgi:hypothetical protein